ncbi:helix-turn-helix domain-containing protein [Blastococcus sp. LR1]|uniref:helix-turn-helix domain-containing protein n=1 Tax=Blastococcus sp. LR1 TaxID=2877000 RepID=UPI001CCB8C96|nr:helix-turn-helix domain-containing protein [Blastococcus sp. LR1]MCA0143797.1 helix-turn-helix domain-containing protein [Blastococcus sp. LR1]
MQPQNTAGAVVAVSPAGKGGLLTPQQAGDYLRTGERFVRRLIAERRIPYVKLGKYVRLQQSDLDDFIESGRIPRAPGAR